MNNIRYINRKNRELVNKLNELLEYDNFFCEYEYIYNKDDDIQREYIINVYTKDNIGQLHYAFEPLYFHSIKGKRKIKELTILDINHYLNREITNNEAVNYALNNKDDKNILEYYIGNMNIFKGIINYKREMIYLNTVIKEVETKKERLKI